MAKYDYHFKLKVVRAYLNGNGEYSALTKEFGNLDYIAHSILLEYHIENPQVVKK